MCSHRPARGQGSLLPGVRYLVSPHTTAASESKAEVVLLGGSRSAGPSQGNKDTQTKVGSLAGCWKSEGELAAGRLWVRHSAPGSGMGRAKYVGSPWGAGDGWTVGCDWSVSTLPGEKFWKPGLGHAPVEQCSCLSRCVNVCWVACSGQIQESGIWVV